MHKFNQQNTPQIITKLLKNRTIIGSKDYKRKTTLYKGLLYTLQSNHRRCEDLLIPMSENSQMDRA